MDYYTDAMSTLNFCINQTWNNHNNSRETYTESVLHKHFKIN